MDKYTEKIIEIQKRIIEYNEDFSFSLLNGLELKILSSKAFKIKKWYSSNQQTWVSALFSCIRDNNKVNTDLIAFEYIVDNEDLVYHENKSKIENQRNQIKEICKVGIIERSLIVFQNLDLNRDKDIDMAILAIFKIEDNFDYDTEKIERFIKYPNDHFTSPFMADYLDVDIEKEKVNQELTLLHNNIKSYSHIIYNNIAGNLNDYERLENEKLSKNAQISFNNIKKRSNFIRAMLQIIGRNKLEETIHEFSTAEYKKIAGVIDFMKDNYVSKTQSGIFKFEKNYSYEHLEHSVEGKQSHIFILLWNLLSNADKHKNSKEFTFSIFEKGDFLSFNVSNNAEEEDRKAIENIIKNNEKSDADRGGWAIKEYCNLLNWEISFIDNPNKVEICIKTNIKTR